MRVSFSSVFQANPDGSFTPRGVVRIGGVQMGPGVAFGRGVSVGNIELAAMQGRDLEVENEGGIIVIKGHY